jgi:purine-binding chemotaxis protein CheW
MTPSGRPNGSASGVDSLEANNQFITFTLGEAEYGVDIMMVREIKGWSATTAIPNAPSFIQGVINLRGIIVPIMDLRARLGMAPTTPTKMHVVIISSTGARTTGLLVDAVSDIISVRPDAVRPIPHLGAGAPESLLTGLVSLEDRMVSLVSLDALLGADSRPQASTGDAAALAA